VSVKTAITFCGIGGDDQEQDVIARGEIPFPLSRVVSAAPDRRQLMLKTIEAPVLLPQNGFRDHFDAFPESALWILNLFLRMCSSAGFRQRRE
jgi:hypothetical protein